MQLTWSSIPWMDSWFACQQLKADLPIVWEERMRLGAVSLSQAGTEYPDAAGNPGVMTANKSTRDALSSGNSDHLL